MITEQRLQRSVNALKFERSDIYDVLMEELDSYVSQESDLAVDQETLGEKRIHQCGRASALSDFRSHIQYLRDLARSQITT